jgi:hypothetical protein
MKSRLAPARPDGRPLYYDIPSTASGLCYHCIREKNLITNRHGERVINDPANSPANDIGVYSVCVHHIPDNAVIHDPEQNRTRTKDGRTLEPGQ